LVNLSRNLGGSVGISLVQTVFARRVQYHQSVLTSGITDFNSKVTASLDQLTAYFQSLPRNAGDALQQAHAAFYGIVVQQSVMLAFIDTFKIMAVVFLAVIPVVLLMRKAAGGGPPGAH
jgi:DHA2 family multidrug resistance protein